MNKIENNNGNDLIIPFLKWVGGKRWLISKYHELFPVKYNRYIEPFLGSGSVFFYLKPEKAILADINQELVDTYLSVKQDSKKILSKLKIHHEKHSKEYYYLQRSTACKNLIEKSARFIYLNRTCWNGLYRVNQSGKFNVPIGTRTNVLLNTDNFEAISTLLNKAKIFCSDFGRIIDKAGNGDFIFVDPPYTVSHNNNGFLKYNEKIFSWDDQLRLRDVLIRAKKRGAKILVLNADTPSIRKEYRDIGTFKAVSRLSLLSGEAKYRKMTTELVVKSY